MLEFDYCLTCRRIALLLQEAPPIHHLDSKRVGAQKQASATRLKIKKF